MASSDILLSPEEREHIALLVTQDLPIIQEFCKQIFQFVNNGQKSNPKMFNSASKKLGVQPRQVSAALSALVSVLSRCAEADNGLAQLQCLLADHQFPAASQSCITGLYTEIEAVLQQCLHLRSVQPPQLLGANWRLDVVAATRSAHGLAEPLVTLHLHTTGEDLGDAPQPYPGSSPLQLQTDAPTLRRVTVALEEALQQTRAPHHSRLSRALS